MKSIIKYCFAVWMILLFRHADAQSMKGVDNSMNAGKVEWVTQQINVGKVPMGNPVTREFEVKNVSTESLMILLVKSNCQCVSTEWSKESVPPGESAFIKVTYDAQREGDFYRVIAVLTNFDTNQSVPLALLGKVEAPLAQRN